MAAALCVRDEVLFRETPVVVEGVSPSPWSIGMMNLEEDVG